MCDLVIRVKNFERQSHLLDVKNEFGLNMLHYFVVHKNLSMVKLLLDHNAGILELHFYHIIMSFLCFNRL